MSGTARRVLAIASAGGHWEQLQLLRPAFDGHQTLFVTTLAGLPERAGIADYRLVRDCNADQKGDALICAAQLSAILLTFRPHRIVTTGALPGLLALAIGRAMGAKGLWIDSVANVEELSAAGRMARKLATQHLSQWPHVAELSGSRFEGRVL